MTQLKTPDNKLSSDVFFNNACFMLAVSLDTLPSITSRRKFKSPTRTHHISQVWAQCPAEHHNVPVINLPSRSTALTCRHTETFLVHLYYTQLKPKYQLEFRLFSPKCTTSLCVFQTPIRIQHELQKLGTHLLHHALAIRIL